MKVSYNWLQAYFEKDLPSVEKVAELFTAHSFEIDGVEEKEGDYILDIKTLPDRNHDCLSHRGIARELGILIGETIRPFISDIYTSRHIDVVQGDGVEDIKSTHLTVENTTPHVRRFMSRIVKNVVIGESPEWLKERLVSVGQRSINNIVDITNFIILDSGQPVHVYDAGKVGSSIHIRNARNEEVIVLLDGQEKKLREDDMVISDSKGNALAIAGVKGGTYAEIDNSTKNILVEIGNFDPSSVRKTARRLGLFTDAAKRFENDLSPELASGAMKEITHLILAVCGGELESVVDVYPAHQEKRYIDIAASFVNKILGTSFSEDDILSIFNRCGYVYEMKDECIHVEVPILRLDLVYPADLVDEIIRLSGYDHLPAIVPKINFTPKENTIFSQELSVRNHFLKKGYREMITYTFTKKGDVEVAYGLKGKSALRTNLSDGLAESILLNKTNTALLGDVSGFFEIGVVFPNGVEEMHIAYTEGKNIIETKLEEFVSEESSDWNLDIHDSRTFHPWSSYPYITRDISLFLPHEESVDQVMWVITENGTDLLVREPYTIDTFEKDGKFSVAIRLVFQSFERTLTDLEVGEIMDRIHKKITEHSEWQIR